ncbi:methyltransferase domain-containing protein [Pelotomaculum terephthalicicum JT]|uniref:class I SAM-dependent methyltransferase n=1 Tax=Pelotomaculum terephthalicicum TaxID=206393 RepID=UPI001F03A1EC|nr:class I SAM-dependent methyltransferase [Pelotomaculum terephthalicicum]MCG9966643.1 methyltransferase domain-containing protein [Pelotomaculum terephthalicicum JT]
MVSKLYPHIPPMTMWRAWEYAAYKHYNLTEPVLDIGCGDGQFFRLVWPEIRDVIGVDIEPGVVKAAKETGFYRDVYIIPAHDMPFAPGSFASVFANCSLEHMDHLPEVLECIARVLHSGGTFLLSVATDKFLEWASLPLLISCVGVPERAVFLQDEYISFHHLVNPLSPQKWVGQLESAGFEVLEYMPILPELNGRIFLFIDNLWHVKLGMKEIGGFLEEYFATLPNFPIAFGEIMHGLLNAEKIWQIGCGAVFYVRKT